MKKLLLLSLIASQCTHPISAPKPVCYTLMAGGGMGMMYSSYNAGSLLLKIKNLNKQLANKALTLTQRTQLTKELATTQALLKKQGYQFLGSFTSAVLGYLLLPREPRNPDNAAAALRFDDQLFDDDGHNDGNPPADPRLRNGNHGNLNGNFNHLNPATNTVNPGVAGGGNFRLVPHDDQLLRQLNAQIAALRNQFPQRLQSDQYFYHNPLLRAQAILGELQHLEREANRAAQNNNNNAPVGNPVIPHNQNDNQDEELARRLAAELAQQDPDNNVEPAAPVIHEQLVNDVPNNNNYNEDEATRAAIEASRIQHEIDLERQQQNQAQDHQVDPALAATIEAARQAHVAKNFNNPIAPLRDAVRHLNPAEENIYNIQCFRCKKSPNNSDLNCSDLDPLVKFRKFWILSGCAQHPTALCIDCWAKHLYVSPIDHGVVMCRAGCGEECINADLLAQDNDTQDNDDEIPLERTTNHTGMEDTNSNNSNNGTETQNHDNDNSASDHKALSPEEVRAKRLAVLTNNNK